MKYIYITSTLCLVLAMGCHRSSTNVPPPAAVTPDAVPEAQPATQPTAAPPEVAPTSVTPSAAVYLRFNSMPLQEYQKLVISGNKNLNDNNETVKKGCADLAAIGTKIEKINDELSLIPELTPEDAIDNAEALETLEKADEARMRAAGEVKRLEAEMISMSKSKLVTATFSVAKARPFRLRNEIEGLKNQKAEAAAGAAEDFSYEGSVDELAASIASKSEQLYARLSLLEMAQDSSVTKEAFLKNFETFTESNPPFSFVLSPKTVELSLVSNTRALARQTSLVDEAGENKLKATLAKGAFTDSANSVEMAVDMSYEMVCGLVDAQKKDLKPSLRMKVK